MGGQLAVLEINPSSLDFGVGLNDGALDGLLEVLEGDLPDLLDLGAELGDELLTASGTFVTGLEKSTVLSLHLGQSSFVDHVLVVSDERSGDTRVPALDLDLDRIKVDGVVESRGLGLTHVSLLGGGDTLVGEALFDSVGSGKDCADHGAKLYLKLFIFLYYNQNSLF